MNLEPGQSSNQPSTERNQNCKREEENKLYEEETKGEHQIELINVEYTSKSFLKFLKENVEVTYNGTTALIKDLPISLTINDKKSFMLKYKSGARCESIKDKIEKACKENCSFKRKCIYYENPDDEIAKIKSFFTCDNDFTILPSIQDYIDEIEFGWREDSVEIRVRKYLINTVEDLIKSDLMNMIITTISFTEDCKINNVKSISQLSKISQRQVL